VSSPPESTAPLPHCTAFRVVLVVVVVAALGGAVWWIAADPSVLAVILELPGRVT